MSSPTSKRSSAKSDSILVVAAHPDDEVLFAGGTIAREATRGRRVNVLLLADGEGARADNSEASGLAPAILARRQAACRAAEILGAMPPIFLGFPDNRLDTVPLLDIVKAIEAVVAEQRPSAIYTHHGGDLNIDHRLAHDAVLTACRPIGDCPVTRIFAGETLSSTEWSSRAMPAFAPNVFVDITETLAIKLQALEAYAAELRPFPHPRSLDACRHLAALRGAFSGASAVEAFELVRWIDRDD